MGKGQAKLEVKDAGVKGRGVFTTDTVHSGDFLCEYKTCRPPFPRKEKEQIQTEYVFNDEGSYIVEAQDPDGRWMCFDATRRVDQFGRYINHAPNQLTNAKVAKPLLVKGKLRLGVVAVKTIKPGQEVLYDYGVRGEKWLTIAGTLF